jgi:ribosomal protein S18 acetylase RimI-like enzyme
MTADPSEAAAPAAPALGDDHDELRFDNAPSAEWVDLWSSVDGRYPDKLDVVAKILTGVPASYVRLADHAVGRGVPQGEWYGIYSMAVAPAARRRGLGRTVLRALLGDARRQGARHAYLLVSERNAPARALYEREGFRTVGRYHYRMRPRSPAQPTATARG